MLVAIDYYATQTIRAHITHYFTRASRYKNTIKNVFNSRLSILTFCICVKTFDCDCFNKTVLE